MQRDLEECLKDIRSRARALVLFTYRMENEELAKEQREREMNMARAHCRDITELTHKFLGAEQPEWKNLTHAQRHAAVKKAFADERAFQEKQRKMVSDTTPAR